MSATRDEPFRVEGGERRCVEVLLLLARSIANQPPGILVHVSTDDPAAPLDLPAWCHLTGHEYLGSVPGTPRRTYALRTAACARRTLADAPWRVSAE